MPPRPLAGSAERGAAAILAIGPNTSSRHPLPPCGELIIGRGSEADVCLPHPSVSRRHARLIINDHGILVEDLGSRNGTLCGGAPLRGPRALLVGDALTVGDFTLVLQTLHALSEVRTLMTAEALHPQLARELRRAQLQVRPLSLLCLVAPDPAARTALAAGLLAALRPLDFAAAFGDAELLWVLPDLDGDDAAALVAATFASLCQSLPVLRGGLCSAPTDGSEADVLLAAVRAVAVAAPAGALRRADSLVQEIDLGERRAILADPAMWRLYALLQRLGQSEMPILITGETGTGKELAASAVHRSSPRRDGPFLCCNCAALTESIAESELFGHSRGAFSGAAAQKVGLLEAAHGGTLFLDEVGELSLPLQAKLLRALETRRVRRVGETREVPADARVVAATNRILDDEARAGRFRQDLLFRLGAARVLLPPLRERPRELPVLARRLLSEACARAQRVPLTLSPAALMQLAQYRWPGNVRELRNAMDFVATTCDDEVVEPWHLPETLELPSVDEASGAIGQLLRTKKFLPIQDELRELEERRMLEALTVANGVHRLAAELIQMPKRTFATKYKLYRLEERFQNSSNAADEFGKP